MKSISFVNTLMKVRAFRRDCVAREEWASAAQWRNCEIALERMANSDTRWGTPICIDWKDA